MAKYVIGLSLAVFSLKFYTHVSYVTKKVIKNNINPKLWTLSTGFLKYAIGFFNFTFQDFGFDNNNFWEIFSHSFFLLRGI